MKLITKTAAAVGLLMLILGQNALAEREQSYFSARSRTACQSSDPAFTAWYFGQTQEVPLVHQVLGPARDQGQTLQCYALAAADMITAHTKIRVSGEQVAHLYYQKSFAGTLQKIFGNNKGGFIASALAATKNQGLCAEFEPVILSKDPDQKSDIKFCESPAVHMKSLSVSGQPSQGLSSGHQLFEELDRVLNRKTIVGIAYRAQDIYPSFQAPFYNSFANHANVIVARHWSNSTSTCDYVIRNTWGESCTQSNSSSCHKGYYSVSEELINKSLQKIDYIK